MDWHRLFGLVLTDFFSNSPYVVEVEKDLSFKQQYLDVVIIRKKPGTFAQPLPDGLDNLVDHNLISFKSHQQAFDAWTMKELIGHYVNYRKQVSPSLEELLPEEMFGLYGVSARYPSQLASQVQLQALQAGVYQCLWGTDVVRLVVLRDLPKEDRNALLHLFSAVPEQVQFAREHYQQRSRDTSSLIQRVLVVYQKEGVAMPYTMEDFRREVREEVLQELTPEELLQRVSPEELLKRLSLEERLRGLSLEERLKGLSPEEIAKYLQKHQGKPSESDQ